MFSFIRHTDKLTKSTKHNRNPREKTKWNLVSKQTHTLELANRDFKVNILIIIKMKKIYV